jgi:hypothetical protein
MQISGVSLTLTWPNRLCLLRVLLGTTTTATSFPLSKHTGGGGTAPTFSGQCVYSSHGKWVFPTLLCFPPSTTFTSFPASGCWAYATTPAFSCRLVIYSSVRDCPSPPLWHSWRRALFAMCLFYCYCLLFSLFFSFFPWWGLVCPGAYAEVAQGCL